MSFSTSVSWISLANSSGSSPAKSSSTETSSGVAYFPSTFPAGTAFGSDFALSSDSTFLGSKHLGPSEDLYEPDLPDSLAGNHEREHRKRREVRGSAAKVIDMSCGGAWFLGGSMARFF